MANPKDYKIATLASHTALQILKGAKEEGFETIAICQKGKRKPYESYGVADKIIEIEKFEDYFEIEQQLIDEKAIVIPHGSFVSYLGFENVKKIKAMHYGNRNIIEWESDRSMERKWLLDAGLNMPKLFDKPEDIDRPVIIKFNGAGGGKGYFIANNPEEFHKRMEGHPDAERGYVIQEYIVGVPIYTHYFHSPVTGELEIMSFDKRYESNADSVGRIAAKDQVDVGIQTTYTITGNVPIVVRESLLPKIFEMGEGAVEASKKIVDGGLWGPFCLEAIVDPNLDFFVFEISARIVAGTNPFVHGSPYTWLRYDEPMSTGRRLARDIKEAIEEDKLPEVLG
ncbi:formate--phosphoribosylaminoimidazolecarboxamide ligase [Candidatus Peregrinibacteria bacterium]|jgi:5-formaminoimidazole-4-carboxamide-1-(beta)-D-ribofuranosyl 5'-monophosphate synthetase|nr:formate--phosphoribosylaminoimidazolecarboxamide ligase [Candidatus Peregrinibacteria bacterium]MBT4148633.1 formate--phosphoribosylaminoimidazolecarboxamide ligase [Candidatus Peregrinibacteria bacterium]MBT4366232.1 formate--phosphoribosylaminoimidazolecarboxamide ligase [Candidatus Peregrinibacteria bacterium]MBT4456036.1 formate--phosphoribosylaminoimidazolecarboxamide ligase [Candidatus Peregrinibacteria bacterium]